MTPRSKHDESATEKLFLEQARAYCRDPQPHVMLRTHIPALHAK